MLGGNDDDTICTAGSIDSGSRCIFQYRDAFDITGVQEHQRIFGGRTTFSTAGGTEGTTLQQGHTIHYIQRLLGTTDGTRTTDVDVGSSAGFTRGGRYQYTGRTSLKHLIRGSDLSLVKILLSDAGDRTGQVLHTTGTITYDHHIRHGLSGSGKTGIYLVGSRNGHFKVAESDRGDHERPGIGRNRDGETSIRVGGTTRIGAFSHNGRSGNRRTILGVRHPAGDSLGLSECYLECHQHHSR